ncbi:alpha- and gamma-adaptin-binding protein p34 isoform X2 [Ambystoma mexicanum]|uniref:alpha- and gamma-adaptin-binding protein p34 isoform X2 n=1 Tax=Ambystoma mexicanum TaxID=8296 RepID=UPI0037E8BD46
MATTPCALITSTAAGYRGEELVREITGTKELHLEESADEKVRLYPWTIDNKYYSADINLCVVADRFSVTSEIAETIQAFVVYFDSTIKCGLDSVSTWIPMTEDWLPDVLILVCDRTCDDGVSRQNAQEWCIRHGFELVELSPEEVPDEDDDFPESLGVKRIVQALNANVWSNMEMKSDHNHGFGLFGTLTGTNRSCGAVDGLQPALPAPTDDAAESQSGNGGDVAHNSDTQLESLVDPMLDMDIQELASLTTGDGDLENFGRLFTKLQEMKDKASTMPHEQRKLHAEKVAKAFWMAIGGDRDEIEGLSSEEDD